MFNRVDTGMYIYFFSYFISFTSSGNVPLLKQTAANLSNSKILHRKSIMCYVLYSEVWFTIVKILKWKKIALVNVWLTQVKLKRWRRTRRTAWQLACRQTRYLLTSWATSCRVSSTSWTWSASFSCLATWRIRPSGGINWDTTITMEVALVQTPSYNACWSVIPDD